MTLDMPLDVARLPKHLPRRRRRLIAFGVVLAGLLLFLWFIGVIGGNVRVVVPGRFYRSAQLSGSHLERVLRRYGIRSVINLRGSSDKPFYRSERAVCREMGVAHYDVSLTAYHLPNPVEMRRLIADLDAAPRPVLVHCQQGADRSGLVSTLYANAYEGVSLDRAESEELTWRYGHFAFVGTWRMERFFDLYRATSGGQDLRSWTLRTYPSVYERETARR